jgi:PAS domain S-box-containing protein
MLAPLWKRSETWGLAIALLTLLALLGLSYRDWNSFLTTRAQAAHTQTTLNLLSEVFSDVQDLETGQRGYLLAGDPPYLAPYEAAKSVVRSKLAELERETADDATQRTRIQRIDALLQQKMAELQRTVDVRLKEGSRAALAIVETGEGRVLMDRIRGEAGQFRAEQQARLQALESDGERYRLGATYILVGGSAFLFVLLVIAFCLVRKRSKDREGALSALEENQRSLALSEKRFRSLVSGTTAMVWHADASGHSFEPLPQWEEFTGQPVEEYRGTGGINAMHPEDRERVATQWAQAVKERQNFDIEFRLWHRDTQSYKHMISRGVPLLSPEGKVVEWIGTLTDVTDQRRLAENLNQAAKLESLGVLAGGVAHDFNNLLVGVLGNASLLETMLQNTEQIELARQIQDAAERAAVLTRQMLAYSGRGRFVVEPVDLAAEIDQILELLKSSVPKQVELVVHSSGGIPRVEMDRSQFQQLVINLVTNGAEAIRANSGTVTVSTYVQTLETAEGTPYQSGPPLPPGRYVVIEVRDTGIGMDTATQAKIFDPFFSTKFTGRGLGLAAAQGIVRGHNGAIQVSSTPGSGSIFRVFLPAGSSPADTTAPNASQSQEARTPTVLVVDDEEIVRTLAQRALAAQGFQVLLAENGQDAIDVLNGNRNCAAILLDLSMPVMSGEDALPLLRRISPGIRILLSSGYGRLEAERRFGNSIDGFIQKPYSAKTLVSAIQEVLQLIEIPRPTS